MLAAAGALAAAPPAVVIDDFERDGKTGWGAYKDAESPMPHLSISDETISGDGALKVFIESSKRYVGISLLEGIRLPANAVSISFLVKPAFGAPPENLTLTERTKEGPKGFFTAAARINTAGDDWQKITIPLRSMNYPSYAPAKLRGRQFPFKPGAVYSLQLNGAASEQPAIFFLDNLVWELKP